MLLSGKLNPATVIVSLLVVPGVVVPPQAVATVASAARAAINQTDARMRFMPSSLTLAGLPDPKPRVNSDSSTYAVLKVRARAAAGARRSRIPRGTRSCSTPHSDTSVASASRATSRAPANSFA